MDLSLLANLAYIVSAALFIFGLKMLGSPSTARRGNMLSAPVSYTHLTLPTKRIV